MFQTSKVCNPPSAEQVTEALKHSGYVIVPWKNKDGTLYRNELYVRDMYDSKHCEGFGMFNLHGRSVEVKFCFKQGAGSHIIFM